ncbi:MAK10-like protein [Tanacetum coccineum]|uniref:MAK10-like protein n=1 Tax=Tanacetum coccineum TaxID=301880 RepID=A0ABQ5B404_9ASTR
MANLESCVNVIPLYLFKKINIGLLEETDHIFGLADGTKSYPFGIVKEVEVHIGKLKLLNNFYVIDMKKDPETPLLVGRGFLATANAVIDCKMAKIAVGEGITRSVFGVKGVDLGEEEAPYWTTLGKSEITDMAPSATLIRDTYVILIAWRGIPEESSAIDFEQRLETIFGRQVNRVHTLDFEGLTLDMRQRTNSGAYWLRIVDVIPDKGDLSDYWVEISSGRDFLRGAPSYTYIRDPVQRLCHMLISYNFSMKGQAPEKAERIPVRLRVTVEYMVSLLALTSIWNREWNMLGCVADPAPVLAPQPPPPPPAAGRTMP